MPVSNNITCGRAWPCTGCKSRMRLCRIQEHFLRYRRYDYWIDINVLKRRNITMKLLLPVALSNPRYEAPP